MVGAFEACRRDIDPRLAEPEAVSRVLEALSSLPLQTTAAYLECRTAPGAAQVDLLLCMTGADAVAVPSTPGTVSIPGAEDGDEGKGWRLANTIQHARRSQGSGLHGEAPLIWLEFDDAGRAPALPPPSVCVCIEPGYLGEHRLAHPNAGCEASAGAAGRLAALDEATMSLVVRCLRALPEQGHTIHFSFMCARPGNATKLYQRVPLAGARRYLDAIGWDGDGSRLDELLDWRRPTDRFVHLDVSIEGGRILPRLGLAFPRDCDKRRFSHPIFEGLAAHCLDATEVEAWKEAGDAWIRTEPTVRLGRGSAHVVHRWIDQKIVFDRTRAELKLYLAIRPLPGLFGALSG